MVNYLPYEYLPKEALKELYHRHQKSPKQTLTGACLTSPEPETATPLPLGTQAV